MKKFFKWAGIGLAVAIGLAFAGPVLWWNYLTYSKSHEWSQKVTVQVETTDRMVSGSAITQIIYSHSPNYPDFGTGGDPYKYSGEAVVVEVLPGKYMFALLVGASHKGRVFLLSRAFSKVNLNGAAGEVTLQFYQGLKPGDKTALPDDHYPLLVTFTDINDPSSVQRVDPNDLAAHFGAGVKLKTITLEITNEPVTRGRIEKVLGWLKTHAGYLSGKHILDQEFHERNLTISSFIKGLKP